MEVLLREICHVDKESQARSGKVKKNFLLESKRMSMIKVSKKT